ncbi:putative estradiol 17 beta-dehydrogenase [Hypoxylon argillaceum]|nr:putative estradiol 17 beta-dehydrogenase [Hypoxylon argillaceum]
MPSLSTVISHFFPPKPAFTEKDVPDLEGKVCIVTGSNTGIGKETARVLYAKNAKVGHYTITNPWQPAVRSYRSTIRDQGATGYEDIKKSASGSKGSLVFLQLDLADLPGVKTAAEAFLAREEKLHTLINNAGVMIGLTEPPPKTSQGHELSLGVNCVGTLLFTRLVTPALQAAAAASTSETKAVRVVWLSSFTLELRAHEDYGLRTDNLDYHNPLPNTERYGLSKCGVWCLGVEYARRYGSGQDGISSVIINPGNFKSELQRDQGWGIKLITFLVGYPAALGANTELFAAYSPEAAAADVTKTWVGPFGRVLPLRQDLCQATKPETNGGTDGAKKFWDWTEEQIKGYL